MASYPVNTSSVLESIDLATTEAGWGHGFAQILDNIVLSQSTSGQVMVETWYPGMPVSADTVVLNVNSSIWQAPNAGEIVWMGQGTSAVATFPSYSPVQAMIVGNGGNSTVTFNNTEPVAVQLTGGLGDTLNLGAANDVVAVNGGNYRVALGEGDNIMSISSGANADNGYVAQQTSGYIIDGGGDLLMDMGGKVTGELNIDAGAGFDKLTLYARGQAALANTAFAWNDSLDCFGMQYTPQNAMDGTQPLGIASTGLDAIVWVPTEATQVYRMTVQAATAADSLCAKLYQIALGRQPFDAVTVDGVTTHTSTDGIEFWMSEFDHGQTYDGLRHTIYSFLNCAEFHNLYDGVDDAAYIRSLFSNLGATGSVYGKTQADYVTALAAGGETARFDAAWEIAASSEAVQLLGNTGQKFVIDGDFQMYGPGMDVL